MLSGDLIHLDIADLTALKASYLACLTAISTGHQSYSLAGRSFTRGDLAEVRRTLGEIAFALQLKTGNVVRTVYSDFSQQ
jgi:hypothetical protein